MGELEWRQGRGAAAPRGVGMRTGEVSEKVDGGDALPAEAHEVDAGVEQRERQSERG